VQSAVNCEELACRVLWNWDKEPARTAEGIMNTKSNIDLKTLTSNNVRIRLQGLLEYDMTEHLAIGNFSHEQFHDNEKLVN
jgi:hypothetical protein